MIIGLRHYVLHIYSKEQQYKHSQFEKDQGYLSFIRATV